MVSIINMIKTENLNLKSEENVK